MHEYYPGSSLIYRPVSYVTPLELDALFPAPQPLEVELGSGDGSFLLQHARTHPQRNFLAVDRLLGRLGKLDRKGVRAGLTNLRLLRIEAGYFLEFLLPPGSIHALHVYFPDPWPKRRHHRRRLINAHFFAAAQRALVPGGRLYLRTDDSEYFAHITAAAKAVPGFELAEIPPELSALVTDFEDEFMARGIAIYRAAYTSMIGPPPSLGPGEERPEAGGDAR